MLTCDLKGQLAFYVGVALALPLPAVFNNMTLDRQGSVRYYAAGREFAY